MNHPHSKKIKDMTPDEFREYNRLARRRRLINYMVNDPEHFEHFRKQAHDVRQLILAADPDYYRRAARKHKAKLREQRALHTA